MTKEMRGMAEESIGNDKKQIQATVRISIGDNNNK